MSAQGALQSDRADWRKLIKSPAAVLFLSSNIANAANLLFNMIFARLMGPEIFSDLALLLTLKLAGLSIFSAIQFGVTKTVAAEVWDEPKMVSSLASISKLSFKVCIPICLVLFACVEWLTSLFSLQDPTTLVIVIFTIPALVPVSLYRGAAYGRIDLPRIVSSFQFEWVVRLTGGLILWQAGVGLIGVAAALTASVYIAALCSTQTHHRTAWLRPHSDVSEATSLILKASCPFMAIQFAQVFMLDGELFIAKSLLSAEEAGYQAALGLIQRIFFFTFLSFATLLLPMVAQKASRDDLLGARTDLVKMLGALAGIAIVPLAAITFASELVCEVLFGSAFAPMSALAPYAAVSALSFAITHLIVMYHVAQEHTFTAYVFAAVSIIELLLVGTAATVSPNLQTIVMTKLFALVCIAIAALLSVRRVRV